MIQTIGRVIMLICAIGILIVVCREFGVYDMVLDFFNYVADWFHDLYMYVRDFFF